MAGETAQAEAMAKDLNSRYPLGHADAVHLAAGDPVAIGA